MEITPQIYTAKVMHKRQLPKINQFTYGVYYLALPIAKLATIGDGFRLGYNRRALLSIYDKDHGKLDGSPMQQWVGGILNTYGFTEIISNITLITMPRVLGYVFNPVSFWLCTDKDNNLRAVICEVHNTFGETHSYVCANPDHSPINSEQWLEADKQFHVSPFMERNGHYTFRFALKENKLGIWIDYYNTEQNKQLVTSLSGTLVPLTRGNLSRVFWSHPLVTLKTIALIHWQAVKLFSKGIRYIVKPAQLPDRLSATRNLTKS